MDESTDRYRSLLAAIERKGVFGDEDSAELNQLGHTIGLGNLERLTLHQEHVDEWASKAPDRSDTELALRVHFFGLEAGYQPTAWRSERYRLEVQRVLDLGDLSDSSKLDTAELAQSLGIEDGQRLAINRACFDQFWKVNASKVPWSALVKSQTEMRHFLGLPTGGTLQGNKDASAGRRDASNYTVAPPSQPPSLGKAIWSLVILVLLVYFIFGHELGLDGLGKKSFSDIKSSVSYGMSRDAVVSVLGKPDRSQEMNSETLSGGQSQSEFLYYTASDGEVQISFEAASSTASIDTDRPRNLYFSRPGIL